MKTYNILLKSINDVKNFVNSVNKYDFDIDLTSGRYVVDAKSIMGIFSLDLSSPIKIEIHSNDCDDLYNEIKDYII
jgi:phosphotransferase system HPr-like phosphotransfer protein